MRPEVYRVAMVLNVECALTPAGALEPQVVWFGARRVDVREVIDRWYGSSQRWWKVDTEDGLYVLRLDDSTGVWDLAAVVRQ
jgi:hypothetical protein